MGSRSGRCKARREKSQHPSWGWGMAAPQAGRRLCSSLGLSQSPGPPGLLGLELAIMHPGLSRWPQRAGSEDCYLDPRPALPSCSQMPSWAGLGDWAVPEVSKVKAEDFTFYFLLPVSGPKVKATEGAQRLPRQIPPSRAGKNLLGCAEWGPLSWLGKGPPGRRHVGHLLWKGKIQPDGNPGSSPSPALPGPAAPPGSSPGPALKAQVQKGRCNPAGGCPAGLTQDPGPEVGGCAGAARAAS